MIKNRAFLRTIACTAGLGVVAPASMLQAASTPVPAAARQISSDVVLTRGTLSGQYLSGEGLPVDGAEVLIQLNGEELARTTTDSRGTFNFTGLKNGSYEIVTPSGIQQVRAWDQQVAPPAASQYATVVSQGAVRGQNAMGGNSILVYSAIGFGIAGLATGIIGINEANDANNKVDDLIDDLASP